VTGTLRLVDTGTTSARWNIAVTAALAELHAEGRIPDTLRLHRYPVSVLLGRSQDARTALDPAACARRGAEIARRVTGGGAVAMGPGILAWDLVAARRRWPSLEAAAATIGGAVVAALATFGLAAGFRPPGDVTLLGRKVAGTAGAFDGPTLVAQGSLLVSPDTATMAALLGVPTLPVTTLAAHIDLDPAAVAAALAAAIADALGFNLAPADLTQEERARAAALLAEETLEALP